MLYVCNIVTAANLRSGFSKKMKIGPDEDSTQRVILKDADSQNHAQHAAFATTFLHRTIPLETSHRPGQEGSANVTIGPCSLVRQT